MRFQSYYTSCGGKLRSWVSGWCVILKAPTFRLLNKSGDQEVLVWLSPGMKFNFKAGRMLLSHSFILCLACPIVCGLGKKDTMKREQEGEEELETVPMYTNFIGAYCLPMGAELGIHQWINALMRSQSSGSKNFPKHTDWQLNLKILEDISEGIHSLNCTVAFSKYHIQNAFQISGKSRWYKLEFQNIFKKTSTYHSYMTLIYKYCNQMMAIYLVNSLMKSSKRLYKV